MAGSANKIVKLFPRLGGWLFGALVGGVIAWYWKESITWADAHEKLAGWAQAIGAFVAIVAAFAVTTMQARHALKHDDRHTAERIRSLARLFYVWREICQSTQFIREATGDQDSVDAINRNREEFNHIASEINKFDWLQAPSEEVLRLMMRYRPLCGPLSNYMTFRKVDEQVKLPDDDLAEFARLIDDIERLAKRLMHEADRLAVGGRIG